MLQLKLGLGLGCGQPVTIICQRPQRGKGLTPVTLETLGGQAHAAPPDEEQLMGWMGGVPEQPT